MDKALVGMCVNERSLVKIPPHLAYGEGGYGAYAHVCFSTSCRHYDTFSSSVWGTGRCLSLVRSRYTVNTHTSGCTAGAAQPNAKRKSGPAAQETTVSTVCPAESCCTVLCQSHGGGVGAERKWAAPKASSDVRGASQTRKQLWIQTCSICSR